MLLQRLHGLLFLLLGVVSIADGWRITQQARPKAPTSMPLVPTAT